ncbi:MAG: hypothetical protein LQ339_002920 [Xanthoria mediterranea]|nr:MAG: hypothetical protein LQ339_002920 [Xanthoria mediterranea]
MVFKPESLVTLREKDASALRAAYCEIKEQYETVLDERDRANKKLERMRQNNRDLQTAFDAADQKVASVSRPGLSLEFEQGKSKIAELQAALKQEVARSKATQSELEATGSELEAKRSELEASRDCVRDLEGELSTVVAKNSKAKVFRDRIMHALAEFDAFGDAPDSISGPESDVEPEAVVPKEEPESSPQPIQAPAPTPKGAYLAQPRIPVPMHAIASLTRSWGPTPRQWMTIKQQEDFKDQLVELEASMHDTNLLDATKSGVSAVNNVVPANPTPRISALPAATPSRKRDASDANMELITQEDIEMGLEELPRESTPQEPERKKPRLGGL